MESSIKSARDRFGLLEHLNEKFKEIDRIYHIRNLWKVSFDYLKKLWLFLFNFWCRMITVCQVTCKTTGTIKPIFHPIKSDITLLFLNQF